MVAISESMVSETPQKRLVVIAPNDLPSWWPELEPMVKKACDESRGRFTLPMIFYQLGLQDGIERWRMLAIDAGDRVQAFMCVAILQEGQDRVLSCVLAGGERAKEWPEVDPQFDELARAWGCVRHRIEFARKGWAKALPHWKTIGYVMEREV